MLSKQQKEKATTAFSSSFPVRIRRYTLYKVPATSLAISRVGCVVFSTVRAVPASVFLRCHLCKIRNRRYLAKLPLCHILITHTGKRCKGTSLHVKTGPQSGILIMYTLSCLLLCQLLSTVLTIGYIIFVLISTFAAFPHIFTLSLLSSVCPELPGRLSVSMF